MKKHLTLLILFLILFACQKEQNDQGQQTVQDPKQQLSPDKRYGALFEETQMAQLFRDSKTFADAVPNETTDEIISAYEEAKDKADFDLNTFINSYFKFPEGIASDFKSDTSRNVQEHINVLWDVLTRQPDTENSGSLIPLPNPYIVPGGRFREVYYWDSYFTMLGLQVADRYDMIEHMVDNFSHLIETMGFIPNGNRTYYQGRSQPPFYALMVRVLAEGKGEGTLGQYLPYLQKEYDFWMDGQNDINEDQNNHRRLVQMPDGSLLNRYYDDIPEARPESFREDVELFESIEGANDKTYRDIRAGAESGWDYSSRWFADGENMSTIETTDIIPVDLNSLLYHLEQTLADAYEESDDEETAKVYTEKAEARANAIQKYHWDAETGFFRDYNWVDQKQTEVLSLAGMYPLFFQLASAQQAREASELIEHRFLQPGGVTSTLRKTGQQWDAPNGWAPLQWITIQGLRNYNINELAGTIKTRWVDFNADVYKRTGKLVEKYNVFEIGLEGGGGEYPVQDGFGWTNGVLLKLLSEDQ